jgi:hypothetical protein
MNWLSVAEKFVWQTWNISMVICAPEVSAHMSRMWWSEFARYFSHVGFVVLLRAEDNVHFIWKDGALHNELFINTHVFNFTYFVKMYRFAHFSSKYCRFSFLHSVLLHSFLFKSHLIASCQLWCCHLCILSVHTFVFVSSFIKCGIWFYV